MQKSKSIRALAIETSCDETSAAVIDGVDYPQIKTNIIASQIDLHKITGGVVPEVAARAHCEQIIPVIEQALGGKIHEKIKDIDAIAVTVGPGLVGSLLVGVETAKALAYATGKPLIPVNHLEGHIFAAMQQKKYYELSIKNYGGELKNHNTYFMLHNTFPALALVVSGGHTELVLVKDMFDYEVIGQTLDDAAGEAFDKVGTLLGLEYPCGPKVSEFAEKHRLLSQKSKFKSQNDNSKVKIKLPRPMLKSGDLNFSFSGLKTAVVNLVKSEKLKVKSGELTEEMKMAIAYEFQEAAVEVLTEKTFQAFSQITNYKLQITNKYKNINSKIQTIILTGGVSANKRLREAFNRRFGDKLLVSPIELCGDNAGMIGLAGWHRLKLKSQNLNLKTTNQNPKLNLNSSDYPIIQSSIFPWQSVDVDPNLEL